MPPLLELRNVVKSFGRTAALDGVSLSFLPGRVAAVVGQNGAGKTTAMRVAAGFLLPDAGSVALDGEAVRFSFPREAAAAGIQMVHQHFMLVNQFTIAENIALVSPPSGLFSLDRNSLERSAEQALRSSGIPLERPHRRVTDLSVGERARLELVKALVQHPRLLILDEPTSVLTPLETAELAEAVHRLASAGVSVVIVTHKLPEVFELADVVHVMRDGRVILEEETARSSPARLAEAMIGSVRAPDAAVPATATGRDVLLCRGLSTPGLRGMGLQGADLRVRAGEIAGIVGVAGNGQLELAETLRGLVAPTAGEVRFGASAASPAALASERRIAHIPADRTREGIVAEMSVAENIALGDPRNRLGRAEPLAQRLIEEFSIRALSPRQLVGSLSGGNQQKVVLARELDREPELIVASEPTRGLDLESTRFVHGRLRAAAARGAAVLIITSDLDEAFSLCSVVQVLYRGTLSEPIDPRGAETRVGQLMAGVAP